MNWNATDKDIWIANQAYTTSGTNLNAWYQQSVQNYPIYPTAPVPPMAAAKKEPETAVAWLRGQVEEVTQLAA